ncbi:hypothetical protein [Halocatena salina]|uniref:Uncharacterized protein n=1 Tax=Halocatena salina TaxID=2934340 RepID=A0A8U0A0V8_9EURY|nr:hypothetical protein [Halocatena salina]UPM42712.1 hypothetical protein MW046_12215 [Halocatena salina]
MSNRSVLLDLVCAQRRQMKLLLALLIACGLLIGLSVLYVGPGDASFPVLVVDIVLVVGGFVFFSTAFWYCTNRAMDE